MIIAESRRGRRIVGRLDRGMDLFAALIDLCRKRQVRAGELRGLGSLEAAELAEYDQENKVWKPSRRFAGGGFEILSLLGNVSERDGNLALHAHVTLMRDRDNGIEVVGGHLVSARVFAFEFVVEAFDDVVLRRGADGPTGLVLWQEAIESSAPAAAAATTAPAEPEPDEDVRVHRADPVSAPAQAPMVKHASSSTPSWSQVAAVSAARPANVDEPSDEGDDSLQAGDVLLHPTFGRCEVQRIEGSYEFAHVRLKNGRLVRLSLEVLKVSQPAQEGGRRVFRARVE